MTPWKPTNWRIFDRILSGLIIVMFLVFGIAGVWEHHRTSRLAHQGAQAHDAICSLRGDLERRVRTTEQYLEDHPQGFAGIPAATIHKSLVDQRRTIDSLSKIRCGRPEPTETTALPTVPLYTAPTTT